MSDPLRTEGSRAPGAAPDPDRDGKIEQLLLVGLDHYFAAEYDQAIHVWTRALFLDRGHARARAYIERARSALAERQREGEELLQLGLAALQRGDTAESRRLLQAALSSGASPEEALGVLERVNRLEAVTPAPVVTNTRASRDIRAAVPRRERQPTAARSAVTIAIVLITAVGAVGLAWSRPATWRSLRPLFRAGGGSPAAVPLALPDSSLPLPRRGEIALARARAYAAGGHLHEALAALDRVQATDPQKGEADQLRATLQRQLIELAPTGASASAPERKGEGPSP